MKTAVLADAITYERGSSVLLDRVSFAVPSGEFLSIVGPNGAGKTTLLSILAGDLFASSGRAKVRDVDPAHATPQRLAQVRAYLSAKGVSENPFTVWDTVAMGRHPHRRTTIEAGEHDRAVESAMASTDVVHLGQRTVSTLSTGELQRVALARIIAQETPLLLLDEPTSALDIAHQETVMQAMRDLTGRGTTVVAVLHDINLASAHTDRILLLSAGRAVAIGPPSEVLTSESLTATYRQRMEVIAHPYRDCPLVLTVHREDRSSGSTEP